MTRVVIDQMDDATRWSPVAADGVTPSTQVSLADESVLVGSGADRVSGVVTASAGATGHALRRTMAPVDLTDCTELRLSIRADRPAGTRAGGFYLELRLASQAMALSDPANTWHRLLPVSSRHTWETVRLSIDDLPAAIRGALTDLQLRCVAAPFTAYLDDVVALRPRMLADADRALVAAFEGITVDTAAAAVAVRTDTEPAPGPTALDIVQVDLRPAPARSVSMRIARDHTTAGYRFAEPGAAYDVDYAVRPVAATRAAQAALLEAAVDRLPLLGELVVDGDRLPVELVTAPGGDGPVLVYRIGVRGPARVGPPVSEVDDVLVGAHHLEEAV